MKKLLDLTADWNKETEAVEIEGTFKDEAVTAKIKKGLVTELFEIGKQVFLGSKEVVVEEIEE